MEKQVLRDMRCPKKRVKTVTSKEEARGYTKIIYAYTPAACACWFWETTSPK